MYNITYWFCYNKRLADWLWKPSFVYAKITWALLQAADSSAEMPLVWMAEGYFNFTKRNTLNPIEGTAEIGASVSCLHYHDV